MSQPPSSSPEMKRSLYRSAATPIPSTNTLWPLYGAGLENLGVNGKPIQVPMPSIGPDELLVRHDACGLCFSDTKVIAQGESHPRIQRDMKAEPVVLGHEVSMTIVSVGENLRAQYHIGDRVTLQPDIYNNGKGMAYGYLIQGGLSQYGVIDRRILHTDQGNYLIPLDPKIGYAESALTEPWACVVAAYRLKYRTGLKPGGTLWVIGGGDDRPFTISSGFDAASHPARLLLTNVPPRFEEWLRKRAIEFGVEVLAAPEVSNPPIQNVDDILLLGANPDLLEQASPFLAAFGIFAILAETPMPRPCRVDVGRIHYKRWVYVGSRSLDAAAAYRDVPVRSQTKPGGRMLFAGAGGPIGRMHVQRAIELPEPPALMVVTDVSDMRLSELCDAYAEDAQRRGIRFVCLNPSKQEEYRSTMAKFVPPGFDDIIVTAPVAPVVSEAAAHLAPYGVMNVFAGLAPGTLAELDMSDAYLRQTRVIGHSASDMDDMLSTIRQTLDGHLSTNRSVAAIGSLSAARDGLRAVKEATYPGKIVIYPHIKDLPLTALPELKNVLPSVYARLANGREWSNEAEDELLRVMLP